MSRSKILLSVKTLMLREIQKMLIAKNMCLVDICLNVVIADIRDYVETKGETCFGIYDEIEKEQICGLFFENSVKNNKISKIVWKIKLNNYQKNEQKVVEIKNMIEKNLSSLSIQIIVNGGAR